MWASLAGAATEKLSGDVAVLESGCSVPIETRLLEAEGKSDAIPFRSSMISDCAVVDIDVWVAGRRSYDVGGTMTVVGVDVGWFEEGVGISGWVRSRGGSEPLGVGVRLSHGDGDPKIVDSDGGTRAGRCAVPGFEA